MVVLTILRSSLAEDSEARSYIAYKLKLFLQVQRHVEMSDSFGLIVPVFYHDLS